MTNRQDSCRPIVDVDHNPAGNTSACSGGLALGEVSATLCAPKELQQFFMQDKVLPIWACACTQVGVEISFLIVACSSSVQPRA